MGAAWTIGIVVLVIWLYLTWGHGRYWRADQHLPSSVAVPSSWPAVVAVVPARDEADVIATSIGSLLAQDYPGVLRVVLVDDASTDGTADVARRAAATAGSEGPPLAIVAAPPLAAGWVGKMGAVHHGVVHATKETAPPYLWLTDADIAHHPSTLRRLVAQAEAGSLDLTSLMVRLEPRGIGPGLLIPAFVYFFQQLYPFRWVNRPGSRWAAAAGGSMLVVRASLEAAGGIAAIRDAVIDDCALARRIRAHGVRGGRLWLGLTTRDTSVRPYDGIGGVWRMVARSAYTQLRQSPMLLGLTGVGLTIVYLAPPVLLLTLPLHHQLGAALAGGLAWGLMAWTFGPTLRLYGRGGAWGLLLPVAGALYLGMTLDSAWQHARGRGAQWKGRSAAS